MKIDWIELNSIDKLVVDKPILFKTRNNKYFVSYVYTFKDKKCIKGSKNTTDSITHYIYID